jgi:RNA polymerase sigma-70 factor, ECF subfamily
MHTVDFNSGMTETGVSPTGAPPSPMAIKAPPVRVPLTEMTDERLMRLIRDGDRLAYRTLVNRHLKRSFALARRVCGNDSEAEDIVQDSFLRIWQRRDRWTDEGSKFTTWLYRVITNRAIDFRRRPATDELEPDMDPPDRRPDAVATIHRREVASRLSQAQAKLPPQQRAAVALFYFNGMNAAEAAAVMDISVNALESLLKRARQQLRVLMRASAQAAKDSFDDG